MLSASSDPHGCNREMSEFDQENEVEYTVVVIPGELAQAKKPEADILRELRRCGYCNETTFAIKLTLEEALTNAIKHGNLGDPTKTVTIRYAITPTQAVFCVCDQGAGFDPRDVPDPTSPDRLPLPNGRGIMLMRAYMDEVRFRRDGCEVFFVKRRQP